MIYDPYCISCCAGAASGSFAGGRAQGRFELLRGLSGCRRAGKRSPRHCGAGQSRGGCPQNSGRADPGRQLCRPGIPCPQAAFPLAHGVGRRAGSADPCLLFFFQHSKATPVQPVEPISPSSEIPGSSAEPAAESSLTQPAAPVSTSDGLTFSLSAEMVHDKLSLKLDYGTVLFVVDPNASDITLQFDGFRTRYLTHSSEKAGTTEFSYHIPKYSALPDSDSALLTITVPENILHEVDIDLAMGDVDLGTLSG